VFWVHASNAARFEQSYRDLADRVKVAGRRDPQANIFKLVHDWLCDCKQRWLLVLDNVDDARFLLSGPANGDGQGQTTNAQVIRKSLREYLPHCERGSILVTTRNKEAALKLVEQRDIVRVEPMDKAQALALFSKKLEAQDDNSNVAELAAVLEYMPLAIVQAAAYISQRAPLCSVAQYLDRFRKSESKRTSLLNRDDGQLRRDGEAKNSIITTWQISFEYIQQTRPSAADLLSLMSFFDRQGIPKSALRIQAELEEGESSQDDDKADADSNEDANTSQSESESESEDSSDDDSSVDCNVDDDAFLDDAATLLNFCFISVNTEGTSFEMHALVQLATRKWLESNGKLERWKQVFVSNLCTEFPTGKYENWTACQALFAHAKAAVSHKPEAASSLTEWATLLYHAAWYAKSKGSASEAEMLAIQSMKVRKKILGREHQETIRSVAMVADAYSFGGRWDEAGKLRREVMETRKTKLGADHPDTLTSMANLAVTYWNQGRWDDAEKLEVQVMETSKTKLGADHPDTLTSMANLASTYWNQGRWDDAKKLFLQVMETFKTKLGADHPDTLTSMANLASTYSNQGRWDDAEKLEVQVMETSKTKLGADHPDTLTSMGNLASTYRNQGRWDDAEKLQVQVVETSKTKLGADYPDTLTSMNNLAYTWKRQGRGVEAIALLRSCVQLGQQKLRADHPNLVSSSAVLARWEAEQAVAD
jgi:tetratricopeptide (TPR) repeat protein